MGQAKLRGTKEQRTADAVAANTKARTALQEAVDRREAAREEIRAAKWANMTQAERDAALKRACDEVSNYGQLEEMFGPETAYFINTVMTVKKGLTK